jgi:glutamine cyclotransferase
VHLEHKLKDSATLKKHNIATLNDLTTFDHNSYWQHKLALYSPILKELGKQKSSDVSNQALNKNGNKIFKKMISLQSYLNEDSTREKCFSPITTINNLFKFLPELECID